MIGGYVKIDLSQYNLEDNVNSRSCSDKIEEIHFFFFRIEHSKLFKMKQINICKCQVCIQGHKSARNSLDMFQNILQQLETRENIETS